MFEFKRNYPGETFFIISVLAPAFGAVSVYISFCFAFFVKFGFYYGFIASRMILVGIDNSIVELGEKFYSEGVVISFLTPSQFAYGVLFLIGILSLSLIDWPIHNRQKREALEAEYGKSWWIGDKW